MIENNKLLLAQIVKNLKEKIDSVNNHVNTPKEPKKSKKADVWKMPQMAEEMRHQIDHQINSDSEREAMQLFDNAGQQKQIVAVGKNKLSQKQEKIQVSIVKKSILNNPKSANVEKDKKQQVQKKNKSVVFSEEQNLIYAMSADKKWTDPIDNQKKGKFQLEEQKMLSNAVGQFLVANQITLDEFTRLITDGNKQKNILKKQKFFKLLASILPNRSPESCYRYVLRNFNSFNRQGEWDKQSVDKLLSLIDKYGRKWKLIGKQLGRTSDNVYDKYRSLGEEGLEERVMGIWKISELVALLTQIQRQSNIQFLDHNIKKEIANEDHHHREEVKQLQFHKYNSKTFIFHTIEVIRKYVNSKLLQSINLQTLRWKKIVKLIPTKNVYDCRNKVVQILQVLFRNQQNLDNELIVFLEKQKIKEESQINWRQWSSQNYTPEQGKNRYMILKKFIEGRSYKPYPQIVTQIRKRVEKLQKSQQP